MSYALQAGVSLETLSAVAGTGSIRLTGNELLLPPNNRTGSRGGLGLDELAR